MVRFIIHTPNIKATLSTLIYIPIWLDLLLLELSQTILI